MDRNDRIAAIVDFVNRHPESVATLAIRRRMADDSPVPSEYAQAELAERLQAVDEETLAGFYYLVR